MKQTRRGSTLRGLAAVLAIAALAGPSGCSPPSEGGAKDEAEEGADNAVATSDSDAAPQAGDDVRDAGAPDVRALRDAGALDARPDAGTRDAAPGAADTAVVAAGPLKPLLVQLDRVRIHDDFETTKPLDLKIWTPIQSTRWAIENGVLKGIPATPEFQASRPDHNGKSPIMDVTNLGDFALDLKFKFEGQALGSSALDFDHHVLALRFPNRSVAVYAKDVAAPVKRITGFEVKLGQWYHALAEVKGNTLVVQFEGGPTVFAESAELANPRGLFRIVGPLQGTVYMDDVTFWTVKPEPQPTWPATRATLP